MGVRYLETSPSHVPAGYRVLWEDGKTRSFGKYVCIADSLSDHDTMTDTLFNRIKGWEQAEALTRTTVIPESEADASTISGKVSTENADGWHTEIRYYQPLWSSKEIPATVQLTTTGDIKNRSYDLKVSRDSTVTLTFKQPIQKQLLLLKFDVVNHTGKAVTITINGVKISCLPPALPIPTEMKPSSISSWLPPRRNLQN